LRRLSTLVGQFDKQAKLAAKVAMQQASEEANSNLKAAGEVLGLFVDASIAGDCPFSKVKERAFGLLEMSAFPSVSNYLRNVAFDKLDYEWTYFTVLSPTIKRNLRHLFCDIDFAGRLEKAPLVTAITVMQNLLRQNKSLRQADSSSFRRGVIPQALKKHLFTESMRTGKAQSSGCRSLRVSGLPASAQCTGVRRLVCQSQQRIPPV
jgi:hypothetical protein